MFLAAPLLLRAYRGLRRFDPAIDGKAKKEKVSALRHLLAASQLMKANNISSLDLSVDSPYRSTFIDYVGNVVRFDEHFYTKDFAEEIGNKQDYAVGSNFYTTRLTQSRTTRVEYPGRPSPVLVLDNELVTILKDVTDGLLNEYGIGNIQSELCLWLLRAVAIHDIDAKPSPEILLSALKANIEGLFTADICKAILPSIDGLKYFLDGYSNEIFSADICNFAELRSQLFSAATNSAGKVFQSQILETDSRYQKVLKAIKGNELNFLFSGPPGTGKTFYAHEIAKKLVDGDSDRIKFLQFHPSVSYDDFIEGYTLVPTDNGMIKYQLEKKHFLRFCEIADQDPNNNYVIVIDEISRGDPSRIFGEMLTYIEPEYRGKIFSLAYSGRESYIPRNLIIIATANPYDRSVGEMDDAFLRRFRMIEFLADSAPLKIRLKDNGMDDNASQRLLHLFDTINSVMPYGFGHAHFFKVCNTDDICELWDSKLKFLLQRTLDYELEKYRVVDSKFQELFPRKKVADAIEELNAAANATTAQ